MQTIIIGEFLINYKLHMIVFSSWNMRLKQSTISMNFNGSLLPVQHIFSSLELFLSLLYQADSGNAHLSLLGPIFVVKEGQTIK